MTMSDLARMTGFSRNTVAKYLDRLYHAGLVEMRSIGPAKYYTIADTATLFRLAEHLPDPVIIINSTCQLRFYNDAYCTIFRHITGIKDPETMGLSLPGLPEKKILTETLAGSYQVQNIRFQTERETIRFRTTCIPVSLEKGEKGALFYILCGINRDVLGTRSCPEWIAEILSSFNIPAVICSITSKGEPEEIVGLCRSAAHILNIADRKNPNVLLPIPLTVTRSLGSSLTPSDKKSGEYAPGTPFICRIPQRDEFILSLVVPGISCQDAKYHIMVIPRQEDEQIETESVHLIGIITNRLFSLMQQEMCEDEIWHAIATILQEAFPGSVIICNIAKNATTWNCLLVSATYIQKATLQEVLGIYPVGVSYTISDKKIASIFLQNVVPASTGISTAFLYAYQPELCQRLAEELIVQKCLILPILCKTRNPAFIAVLLPFTTAPLVQPALFADAIIPVLQMVRMNHTNYTARIAADRESETVRTTIESLNEKITVMNHEHSLIVTDLTRHIATHTHLVIDLIPLISIPAVLVNRIGNVIQLNHQALTLFHLLPEKIINKNWYEAISSHTDENHLASFHDQILCGPQTGHLILQSINVDGQKREYIWTAQEVPLPESHDSGILWLGEEAPAKQLMRFSRGL